MLKAFSLLLVSFLACKATFALPLQHKHFQYLLLENSYYAQLCERCNGHKLRTCAGGNDLNGLDWSLHTNLTLYCENWQPATKCGLVVLKHPKLSADEDIICVLPPANSRARRSASNEVEAETELPDVDATAELAIAADEVAETTLKPIEDESIAGEDAAVVEEKTESKEAMDANVEEQSAIEEVQPAAPPKETESNEAADANAEEAIGSAIEEVQPAAPPKETESNEAANANAEEAIGSAIEEVQPAAPAEDTPDSTVKDDYQDDQQSDGPGHSEIQTKEEDLNPATVSPVITCYTCTSAGGDVACRTQPKIFANCPKEPNRSSGCFTILRVDTNTTDRGCISDLTVEGQQFCQKNVKHCQFCYESSCNNQPMTSGASRCHANGATVQTIILLLSLLLTSATVSTI